MVKVIRNLSGIFIAKFKFQNIRVHHIVTPTRRVTLWAAGCTLFGVTVQMGLEIREKQCLSCLLPGPPPRGSLARVIATDVGVRLVFRAKALGQGNGWFPTQIQPRLFCRSR